VLLDAAAYLPAHPLDLTAHPADFVVASFYKMFGYPTGLGALVLCTELVPQLRKVRHSAVPSSLQHVHIVVLGLKALLVAATTHQATSC
jgi:selenocysteine lyase/cysteine desulfurase